MDENKDRGKNRGVSSGKQWVMRYYEISSNLNHQIKPVA